MEKNDETFVFTSIKTKHTKIGTTIWIENGATEIIQHQLLLRLLIFPRSDRINYRQACDVIFNRVGKIKKILPNKNNISVSHKIYKNLQLWTTKNIKILIQYWEGDIDSADFVEMLNGG